MSTPPPVASRAATTRAPLSRQGRMLEWCSYGPAERAGPNVMRTLSREGGVAVVRRRTDKDERQMPGGDGSSPPVALGEKVDQLDDSASAASTSEEDGILRTFSADTAENDVSGFCSEESGLRPSRGSGGVGIGVQRKNLRADIVLEASQCTSRCGVIRVQYLPVPEDSRNDGIASNHIALDKFEELILLAIV
jgi:hypothetical protein